MTTALQQLAAALESYDNMIAEIHGDTVTACRDWSYASGVSTRTSWYMPDDDYIECYSDIIEITFDGAAFIATFAGKEVAREAAEPWDDEAGITADDIAAAAENMADTIADILPERDLAAEREEARGEALIERYLEKRAAA